jgi:hypothetical protein
MICKGLQAALTLDDLVAIKDTQTVSQTLLV